MSFWGVPDNLDGQCVERGRVEISALSTASKELVYKWKYNYNSH